MQLNLLKIISYIHSIPAIKELFYGSRERISHFQWQTTQPTSPEQKWRKVQIKCLCNYDVVIIKLTCRSNLPYKKTLLKHFLTLNML